MEKLSINIEVFYTQNLEKLSENEQELVKLAQQASFKAYAPYSNFNVGVALLLESGKTITGNNQENVAFPSGLCAERVAMFYANANFPTDPIVSIALASSQRFQLNHHVIFPCGSCRQALLESELRFNRNIKVIMTGTSGIYIVDGIKKLLPLSFEKFDTK